jgi:hypothetical protein
MRDYVLVWWGEWQDPVSLQIERRIAQLSAVEYNTMKGKEIQDAERAQLPLLAPGPPFEAISAIPTPIWIPTTKWNFTQIVKCTSFGGFSAGGFQWSTESLRWPDDVKPPVTDETTQGWPGKETPKGPKGLPQDTFQQLAQAIRYFGDRLYIAGALTGASQCYKLLGRLLLKKISEQDALVEFNKLVTFWS